MNQNRRKCRTKRAAVLLAVSLAGTQVSQPAMAQGIGSEQSVYAGREVQRGAVQVKTVTVTPEQVTIKKGKKIQLKATTTPKISSKNIIWKTNKSSVATVSSTGLVKAKKNGKVTITAVVKGTKKKEM